MNSMLKIKIFAHKLEQPIQIDQWNEIQFTRPWQMAVFLYEPHTNVLQNQTLLFIGECCFVRSLHILEVWVGLHSCSVDGQTMWLALITFTPKAKVFHQKLLTQLRGIISFGAQIWNEQLFTFSNWPNCYEHNLIVDHMIEHIRCTRMIEKACHRSDFRDFQSIVFGFELKSISWRHQQMMQHQMFQKSLLFHRMKQPFN